MARFGKAISLLLVFLLILSTVAACSQKQTSQGGDQGQSAENSTASNEQKQGPSWSWDTSPLTITWYINEGWYNKKWDEQNCLVDKTITEKTGIKVDIQTPAGSDADEKLNTMIASDSLPDVLTMGWWVNQFQLLQAGGKLYPLNELIDKYAPTFKPLIPKSLIGWYTFTDGNWYGFPNYFWAGEQMKPENWIETNAGMFARKDIMDQLGIKPEDFNTEDGMIAALEKVRDAKLQYNGKPVVPVYFGPEGGVGDTLNWILPGMFGIPREDKDGNYIDMRKDPKYLEMLKFANTLYREGLLSKENFTSQREQIEEKLASGGIFLYICNIADYVSGVKTLYKNDNKAVFVPVGPVRANDNAQPQLNSTGMTGWEVTMISKNAKHPDRIIRFFEFLYSDEGQMLTNYGIEGVTYNMVNGKVQWTDDYLKAVSEDSAKASLKYGVGTFYWLYNPVPMQLISPPPTLEEDKIMDNIRKYFAQYAFDDSAFGDLQPRGGTEESTIDAQIGLYWNEQVPKMVMASSADEVERIYNDTLKQMEKMGWDKVLQINNQRFKDNKKKLGIDYAWPPNKQ